MRPPPPIDARGYMIGFSLPDEVPGRVAEAMREAKAGSDVARRVRGEGVSKDGDVSGRQTLGDVDC